MTSPLILRAYEILGKRCLALQIHDASFPACSDEDIGYGTPYGSSRGFLRFAAALGFNALQLGPQGMTDRANPSPYDGTAFSRSSLTVSFPRLGRDPQLGELVDERALEAALRRGASLEAAADADTHAGPQPGPRTRYETAYDSQSTLCRLAYERFARSRFAGADALAGEVASFARGNDWLRADALYEALSGAYGTPDWQSWEGATAQFDRRLFCPEPAAAMRTEERRGEAAARHASVVGRYELCQYLAHRQHAQFRAEAREAGLTLYADLQVGLSLRDRWRLQHLFLPEYLLGAPPSRTNPEGQPWGFPVLHPERYDAGGIDYLRARMRKLFGEYDGVRIDHPQGLVCPWIYRCDEPDAHRAVRAGSRLFSSPDRPDIQQHSIVRPDQIACGLERYADGWVREVDEQQVDRYAMLLSVIMETASERGLGNEAVATETLSTQPYPLKRVMERHGLGRFRITQKMNPLNRTDVYRTDNAAPPDWIMLGNHDTPTIWSCAHGWERNGDLGEIASYLAARLAPKGMEPQMRRAMLADRGELVHAMYADLLVSGARHVSVFFADLLGMEERYNTPGTVGPYNWSLRVPHDYEERYQRDAARLRALNIPYACALALASPIAPRHPERERLAAALARSRDR